MPKRRISYISRLVKGHYGERVKEGRSDTFHLKIVTDSVDYFPYFPQRGTTFTSNTYTEAYDIPMNSPLDALYISSIGTAANAFANSATLNYWVPRAAQQYDHEALLNAATYYSRFCVTSNKIEFFFKAQPPRLVGVQEVNGGSLPILDDYARNGPCECSWTLIGVGPNQNHSEFVGNQTLMMQQPGARVVRMTRGPGTSANLTSANYATVTGWSNLMKWQGKAYAEGDGGYLQNIASTGLPSTSYPAIRPKWILGCTWRVNEDPDGTERLDWTVNCRVRNTFYCTFQLRRTYPLPTLSLVDEEEKKLLLSKCGDNPAFDVYSTIPSGYMKNRSLQQQDDNKSIATELKEMKLDDDEDYLKLRSIEEDAKEEEELEAALALIKAKRAKISASSTSNVLSNNSVSALRRSDSKLLTSLMSLSSSSSSKV